MRAAPFSSEEREFMRRALRLAARGRGRVEPNPLVGAVFVRDGRVVAEGYHRRCGEAHAEVNAIRAARGSLAGTTLYVTLEPCNHFGQTPPCTQALLDAKVARVVAAMGDPDPRVCGRGFDRLRRAGLRVELGLCAAEAGELAAAYLTRACLRRPYVTLKWAQSIDGKLATTRGQSHWISGEAARRLVHRLRAASDAILVGIGTVLHDDPQLTARGVPIRRVATRIILDSQLRTPPAAQVVRTARQIPTLILTSATSVESHARRAAELMRSGVQIESCRMRAGHIDLRDALRQLAKRRMTNVLVEAGSRVLSAFLDAKLADEAYVFIAPRLLGGANAPTAWGGRGAGDLAETETVRTVSIRKIGDDICWRLRLTPIPTPRKSPIGQPGRTIAR
ncbi:MAG TPA: bifunctional diaminohydroxyphosphoribosylaminopyrimidine deaminase/5-amino-6-(5-phosphoribosylamino)uracil reductase RibD [Phycisphaerae bacterium]|jgi:diaminohydroxyphosphoribosylaminopyrimidine deaminase/5-amino-6-(5-phosphoribosylamino)uracil reductase